METVSINKITKNNFEIEESYKALQVILFLVVVILK